MPVSVETPSSICGRGKFIISDQLIVRSWWKMCLKFCLSICSKACQKEIWREGSATDRPKICLASIRQNLGLVIGTCTHSYYLKKWIKKGRPWRPPGKNARHCAGSAPSWRVFIHGHRAETDCSRPQPDLMLHYLAHLGTGWNAEHRAVIAGNRNRHKLLYV